MANYNTPIEYLKEAIDSVLAQTYTNFEFIIIDDASTDSSLSVINSYKDPRINLIVNDENIGLTKSLNKAISISRGKYIARMDSDDVSLPQRFSRQVDYMEEHSNVIVCGTWFEKFGEENRIRKPVIPSTEYYRCQLLFSDTPITMCHPSTFIRKSMLDQYNIRYDESIKKAQDYNMWVECSRYGEMAILNEVLLRYRTHKKQISLDKQDEQYYYARLISRRQLQGLEIDYQVGEDRWRYDLVVNRDDYISFYEWLIRISENNRKIGYLNQNALDLYNDQKLSKALKRIKKPELIKIYCCSNQHTRILVRSLIKNAIKKRLL